LGEPSRTGVFLHARQGKLHSVDISVHLYEDAKSFSAAAGDFLQSRAVHHNLILTVLDRRLTRPEPGCYWVAARAGQAAGVVFQSPLTRSALLVPMEPSVIEALVDAIADAGDVLPGVMGDAATAASFAGRWAEQCKSAAFPTQGLRLYELAELKPTGPFEGTLRKAEAADRSLAVLWIQEFYTEVHEPHEEVERQVDEWLTSGHLWVWENGEAVSIAVSQKPIQGIVRVSHVYTPPENRRRGYAAACVYGISKYCTEAGYRCVLYTDLGNPTSNAIYRRIGYRAVAEAIHYRFDGSQGKSRAEASR
jgi:ribosomal protein S18 acetylase RimI-like enzyme